MNPAANISLPSTGTSVLTTLLKTDDRKEYDDCIKHLQRQWIRADIFPNVGSIKKSISETVCAFIFFVKDY